MSSDLIRNSCIKMIIKVIILYQYIMILCANMYEFQVFIEMKIMVFLFIEKSRMNKVILME
jgi:hypothetical protein